MEEVRHIVPGRPGGSRTGHKKDDPSGFSDKDFRNLTGAMQNDLAARAQGGDQGSTRRQRARIRGGLTGVVQHGNAAGCSARRGPMVDGGSRPFAQRVG